MAETSGSIFETVAVGPIEQIVEGAGTPGVVVLGSFYAVDQTQQATLDIGTYVLAAATDAMGLSSIVLPIDEPYVAGASPVWLRNVVASTDSASGTTVVGSATVDYSAQLSSDASFLPVVGTTVEIFGIQPVEGGSVLMGIHGGDGRRN
jgi:hypothetical protein